ncbi:class I SAM-dependent methyltransferase [Mycobacterium sp. Aquia_213]|uniref:class I SAM-dependent methyltransferase n=1 Tax=Mycobacterium sp. Aquia_213 TaxID=2991728 RepID=UPI002D1E4B0F|nr:class I SAM-dependent methyltransferase [Mycobacterium sp. Aquia_213]
MVGAFAGLLAKGENKRVVDVGCGSGVPTALLDRLGVEAFGIDLSAKMIDEAHFFVVDLKTLKIGWCVQDFVSMPNWCANPMTTGSNPPRTPISLHERPSGTAELVGGGAGLGSGQVRSTARRNDGRWSGLKPLGFCPHGPRGNYQVQDRGAWSRRSMLPPSRVNPCSGRSV